MRKLVVQGLFLGLMALASGLGAGCAGLGGGMTDEEQIRANVAEWSDALAGEPDMEGIMAMVSPNFYIDEVGGKEELAIFLEGAMAQGYLDGGEVFLDDMEIAIDDSGVQAVAGPVDVAGAAGEASVDLLMAKEDGNWLIVGIEPY